MPEYDTVQGITAYLNDLDGLNRLIRDRNVAGYDRKERLRDFVILGRWFADACGNFGKCKFELNYKPTDIPAALPKVVEPKDLYAMLAGLSISHGFESGAAPSHVICPECDKGWTLETAHDTHVRKDERVIPLQPGRSIADHEKDLAGSKEGVFRFGSEPGIRNPKFIDLSPHPEYKNSVVNEKGWRYHHPPFNNERVTQEYIAEAGDESSLTVFIFEHTRCSELRQARWSREFFTEVFTGAGFKNLVMNEIPNEYCPCEACGPWFLAKIPAGDLKIGWRKRVINIDWKGTGKALPTLFESEEVTRGDDHIHAWGKEKAIEYLAKLRTALT
jgi:hypothetical protein